MNFEEKARCGEDKAKRMSRSSKPEFMAKGGDYPHEEKDDDKNVLKREPSDVVYSKGGNFTRGFTSKEVHDDQKGVSSDYPGAYHKIHGRRSTGSFADKRSRIKKIGGDEKDVRIIDREKEKIEPKLDFADRVSLAGFEGVTTDDFYLSVAERERRGFQKNESDFYEDRFKKVPDRLENLQDSEFLNIQNKDGETVADIIHEYVTTITDFVRAHKQELAQYHLISGVDYDQPVSEQEVVHKCFSLLLEWYGWVYNHSLDGKNALADYKLNYLRDGLNKVFANAINEARIGKDDDQRTQTEKQRLNVAINNLYRRINAIVERLPYRDGEAERKKAAA